MTEANVELHYRHGDPCRTLEEAGFGPGQARALVDFLASRERRLVTDDEMTAYEKDVAVLKDDFADLKVRMAAVEGRIDGLVMVVEGLRQEVRERVDGLRQEVRERNDALRLELTAKFDALEARMDGRMAALEGKMDGIRGELRTQRWVLGTIAGLLVALGVPAVAALVRLAFFA